MHAPFSWILCVVFAVAITPVVIAQDADHASPREGPDMTGVWEAVFEDGGTMRLEILHRGDSLYGYIGSSTPIYGTVSEDGTLELRTVFSERLTWRTGLTTVQDRSETGDSNAQILVRKDTTVEVEREFGGRVEPYASSANDRYATSIRGIMLYTNTESGETVRRERFSAAKRFDRNLPSWMRPKTETIMDGVESPPENLTKPNSGGDK